MADELVDPSVAAWHARCLAEVVAYGVKEDRQFTRDELEMLALCMVQLADATAMNCRILEKMTTGQPNPDTRKVKDFISRSSLIAPRYVEALRQKFEAGFNSLPEQDKPDRSQP